MAWRGEGVLQTLDAGFAGSLERMNVALAGTDDVCKPRNAVLDERVTAARATEYQSSGAIADHPDLEAWDEAHTEYLRAYVALPWNGRLPPTRPSGTGDCAAPFRPGAGNIAALDDELLLLRLVRFPTDKDVPIGYDAFADALRRVASTSSPNADDVTLVNAGLRQWDRDGVRHLGPCWVSLFMEARELFGNEPGGDDTEWVTKLRNRVGLAAVSPPGSRLEYVLFGYQVKELIAGTFSGRQRLLAIPCILDSSLYAPFCPAPRGAVSGFSVNLEAKGDAPNREYLHPPIRHRADHVMRVGFAMGSVTHPLEIARKVHLDRVRAVSHRPDYALETEG